jgi:hypothetical protein
MPGYSEIGTHETHQQPEAPFSRLTTQRRILNEISQIKPMFLDLVRSGMALTVLVTAQYGKWPGIHAITPLSWGNHLVAKRKIRKPLV